MVIKGRVWEADGRTPASGVVLYVYHISDISPRKEGSPGLRRPAYHRGWLRTNRKGEYEIRTVRPAPPADQAQPAQIHVVVKAPAQKQCYAVNPFVFKDDSLLTERYWYQGEQKGHIRYAGIALTLDKDGIWRGERNITLYAQYDKSSFNSGPTIGESAPAIDPTHVWGLDKGTNACPMCKYGYGQGVMIWVNTDRLTQLVPLARQLETDLMIKRKNEGRVFFIYMNPNRRKASEVESLLTDFAQRAQLDQVAVLYIPDPQDLTTAGLYRINPDKSVLTTVIIYKNRRVFDKLVNVSGNDAPVILAKVRKAAQTPSF